MSFFKSKFTKFTIPLILLMAVLFLPKIVWAGVDDVMITISSAIATQIIYFAGQLLLVFINLLIRVASFNDFINADIVNIGWVIIRDVANMGIVLALLVIAFYTVLNRESYGMQKMLPKLIIAAIVINFSKTITGLIIDFGQIFMMTFVHAFEDISAGNLTYGFGLHDMLSLRNAAESAGQEVNDWNVFGALVLGVLMVIIALGIVVAMTVMLLYRIVALWILVVLSPLGFVGSIFPGKIAEQSKEWWSRLNRNVVFGPTLAFMFWLSMTVLSQITKSNRIMNLTAEGQAIANTGTNVNNYAFFASQVSSPQRILDYLITCALLIATLITAQKAGVAGSEIAGNFHGRLQKAGSWLKSRPGAVGRGALSAAGRSRLAQGTAGFVETKAKKIRTSDMAHKLQDLSGGALMIDKDYAQQRSERARGRGRQLAGDDKAMEKVERRQAASALKGLEEADAFRTKDTTTNALKGAINKKDFNSSLASLNKAAKEKTITPELANKFLQNFGGEQGSAEWNRMSQYINDAWDMQAAAGDKTVAFKRNVGMDDFGNYIKKSAADNAKDVAKAYGKLDTFDVASADNIKALDSLDLDNKAGHKLVDILADRNNIGIVSEQRRKQLLGYIENVLADDKNNNGQTIGDDQTRQKFVKAQNVLKAIEEDKNLYDRRGYVDQDAIDLADMASQNTNNKWDVASTNLDDVYQKLVSKSAGQGKSERIKGNLDVSGVEKQIRQQVNQLSKSDELNKLYNYRQDIHGSDGTDLQNKIVSLSNELRNSIMPFIEQQIKTKKIKSYDPDTGQQITGDKLTQELQKTQMWKNLNNIASGNASALSKEDALNTIDSALIDFEDLTQWKGNNKQKYAAWMKTKGNVSQARQESRKQTLVTAQRLSTNMDELKKPQTKNKHRSFRRTGTGPTDQVLRAEKTINNLTSSAEFIEDKNILKQIDEVKNNFEKYKKNPDEQLINTIQDNIKQLSGHFKS